MIAYRLLIHALTIPGRLYCALRHPREWKYRQFTYGVHRNQLWCSQCRSYR